jgi:hypothetical protein
MTRIRSSKLNVPRGTLGLTAFSPRIDTAEPPPPQQRPEPQALQPIEGEILHPVAVSPGRGGQNKGKGHISRRLRFAIEQIARGRNITQAADDARMHRNSLSQAMQRPHVLELLERTVRLGLATSAGKAAMRLDHLIDQARSEYVQLEAAKAVLDRSGYAQATVGTLGGDVVIEIKL